LSYNSRNPTRRSDPSAPSTPAPRTSQPDYRGKTPEQYANEVEAWKENQKVDPRIVTYNPYTGMTTYKDDRGRLITVRGTPTEVTAAQLQQEYKERVGTSTIKSDDGKRTMTVSGYARENPILLSKPSEDRVREFAVRQAQQKAEREFKEELTKENYYHKPIDVYNKETGIWEQHYRKLATYEEARDRRMKKEDWYKRAEMELKPKIQTETKKEVSGVMNVAPTEQKLMGWVRKRDPKLAESISYYKSRKEDAPFISKVGYSIGEGLVGGAVLGSAFGVVGGSIKVSGFLKGMKTLKITPYIIKAAPKILKFGSAATVGYKATKEFNIAESKTGSKIEGYKAATLTGTKAVGFIYGFGKGYTAGSNIVTKAYKPYGIKKFQKQMELDYQNKPKFQYERKEPLFAQRTLQGGTISQPQINYLRSDIDKITLVSRKPIFKDGKIVGYSPSIELNTLKPSISSYSNTGQTTLSKPKINVLDKWTGKVSTFKKTNLKFYEADKGRYVFRTLYSKNIPSQFQRPDFSIKELSKQKELVEYGFRKPLTQSTIKQTKIRDMIADAPIIKEPTYSSVGKTTSPKTTTLKTTKQYYPTQSKPTYIFHKEKTFTKLIYPEHKVYVTLFPKTKELYVPFTSNEITSKTIIKPSTRVYPITKPLTKEIQISKPKLDVKQKTKEITPFPQPQITKTTPYPSPIPQYSITPSPTPIPITPPPPIITPFIRPSNFAGRKQQTGLFSFRQPKKYRPTLYASAFKIRGTPTRAGTISGLGIRPIPKIRKVKTKTPKIKMPKINMPKFNLNPMRF
jgi:hypothetical protein